MKMVKIGEYEINKEQICYVYRVGEGYGIKMSDGSVIKIKKEDKEKIDEKRVQHKVHAGRAVDESK